MFPKINGLLTAINGDPKKIMANYMFPKINGLLTAINGAPQKNNGKLHVPRKINIQLHAN